MIIITIEIIIEIMIIITIEIIIGIMIIIDFCFYKLF